MTPVPPSPPAEPIDRQAAMREAIGKLMARSKHEIPHHYLQLEIDMSRAIEWLHDADRKDLDEIMRGVRDQVQRAEAGRLRSSEMSDPTLTVTNLGERGPGTRRHLPTAGRARRLRSRARAAVGRRRPLPRPHQPTTTETGDL